MERSQRPYSIYKRRSKKRKGEHYFYLRFRAEDSRYLPAVASHQTSRAAAANWADAELAKAKIITPGKRGALFGTFAEGFWNYDGDYVTRKLARGGHLSRSFAVLRASQFKRLILPAFKDRPLSGWCLSPPA
jgi:hypothetical protein